MFLELPPSPVTIYERDNVIVTLRFDAEFSNIMVIRALIDKDDDDIILNQLQFQLPENKVNEGLLLEAEQFRIVQAIQYKVSLVSVQNFG